MLLTGDSLRIGAWQNGLRHPPIPKHDQLLGRTERMNTSQETQKCKSKLGIFARLSVVILLS